jgi:segregation and condensation protein A
MIGVIRHGYTLKVKNFEGPMELLLELIQDAKVDITEISLSGLTDQYLMYIRTIQLFNIDVASEFFVVAATLVFLKTRRLLPSMKGGEDDEILDEHELVERLKEYRKFKWLSRMLWEKKEEGDVYFTRGYHPNPMGTGRQVKVESLLLGDLLQALNRYRGYFIKKAIPIKRREISVEAKMEYILQMLEHRKQMKFSEIIAADKNKVESVASFLGSLELSFRQKVLIRQLRLFTDFDVITRGQAALA